MKNFAKEHNLTRRMLAFLLAAVMLLGYVPVATKAEAEVNPGDISTVADPQTLTRPETIYGSNTLNAGKVTVGKSVNNGAVSIEYAKGKTQTFTPAANNFMVTISQSAQVMGLTSEMATPVDVVFVLDTSGSMDSNNKVETMVEAANDAIETLLSANPLNRVGVVAFSGVEGGGTSNKAAASVLTWLGHYDGEGETNHIQWVYSNGSATDAPTDKKGRPTENSKEYIKGRGDNAGYRNGTSSGTNIHAGVALGGQLLAAATETTVNGVTRMPFLVIMSDGQPSYAASGVEWYNPNLFVQSGNQTQAAGIGFLPALTAAYYKGLITEHYYGNAANATNRCYVYTMGLGLAALDDNSENLAYMTMDPANTRSTNTYYDDFEGYYEDYLDGKNFTVTTRSDGRENYTVTEDSITASEKYVKGIGYTGSYKYNDDYFDATDADDLGDAFTKVVSKIQEKAISSPTHVSTGGDHNFEGYVTFTDPIGEYMEVKDIKGILADGYLYQGASFAQKMDSGSDAEFNSMLASVLKKRMSMTGSQATDAFVNSFLASARASDYQANYVSPTNFDNSIVWWGSEYNSGEEDKGVQILGHADNDTIEYIEDSKNSEGKVMVNGVEADYVCRSYFFYGAAGGANPDANHEYMYFMVRVQRELTAPYKETVVISAPASLLSVDEVLINEKTANGKTTYTADVKDVYPARVIYEVGLRSDINAQNVDSIVSDAYRAEKALNSDGTVDTAKSVNYDPTTGTYYFFTNDWDRSKDAANHHRAMAKATFDAAADNSFYTYQEDTLLLNADGTPFTGDNVAGKTLYYEREYYKWTGTGSGSYTATKDSERIEVDMPDTITGNGVKQIDGKWYIAKGIYTASTLVVNGDDAGKSSNNTQTSDIVSHPHRTGTFSNSHYTVLLGNNGKLSLVREPAKSVSVTDAAGTPKDGKADDNDDGETVMVGDSLTYTIKVSNADNAAVTAEVTDAVPKGTAYVENSAVVKAADGETIDVTPEIKDGVLTWKGILIPAKSYVNVFFQVTVTTDAISGANDVVNIDNAATIKLGNNPAYTTNKVTNPPEGKKVVDQNGNEFKPEDTVKVGDVLTYRIRVQSDAVDSNGTPVKADIVVTDQIPAGTTFKSASHGGVHENGTVTWSFTGDNQLAAGASVVLTLEVYVDASAKVNTESGEIAFTNEATIKVGDNEYTTNKVTNKATVGNISITKAFEGDGDATKEFKLTLTESGYKLDGEYDLYIDGEKAKEPIKFNGGIATTTIKKDQVITIKGIPMGATIMVAEKLDTQNADKGWEVSGPASGSYTIAAADETVDVTITNKYTPAPVEFQLKGQKTIDGDNFPDGTFTFRATQVNFDEDTKTYTEVEGGRQVSANATVTNGQSVEFAFSPRVFTKPDTFYYIVNESPSSIKGVSTDDTKYLLKLEIVDNGGELELRSYYQKGTQGNDGAITWGGFTQFDWTKSGIDDNGYEIKFENSYTPTATSVTISGTKTLTGRDMKAGEFSFQLVAREGENRGKVVATANNISDGESSTFSFAPLHFTEADMVDAEGNHVTSKEFKYAIREAQGPDSNVTYDNAYYEVIITVTDTNGELSASTKLQKYKYSEAAEGKYDYVTDGEAVSTNGTSVGGIAYANTYHTQDVSISLSGTKTLSGDAANGLNAEDFTFEVVEADENWNIKNPKVIVTTGANGAGSESDKNVAPIDFADITYDVSLFDRVEAANGIKTLNFYYIVREVIPGENEPSYDVNMKYSDVEYRIHVVLTYNTASGAMNAKINAVTTNKSNVSTRAILTDSFDSLNFENIKNPDKVYFEPKGEKTTNAPETLDKLPDNLRFSFRVTTLDGMNVVSTGLSDAAEKGVAKDVVFTKMEFDHTDVGNTYLYLIEETMKTPAGTNPDIVYDPAQYVLAVTVSRDANNKMVASGTYYVVTDNFDLSELTVDNIADKLLEVDGAISFTNTFNVAKTLNITAHKQVEGDWDLDARDFNFRFQLLEKDGEAFKTTNVVVDGTNGDGDSEGNATVTFGTLLYTTDQLVGSRLVGEPEQGENEGELVYTYQYHALMSEIEPVAGKHAGMTYSKDMYIVVTEWKETRKTVAVEGSETKTEYTYGDPYVVGVYKASYSADNGTYAIADTENLKGKNNDLGVTFVNEYTAQTGTSVTLTATKKLTGADRELKDNDFSFELYRYYKNGVQVVKTLVETANNRQSTNEGDNRTGVVTFTRTYPATISSSFFDSNDIATFIYRVVETTGGIPGMSYSTEDYWAEVRIKHNQDTASLELVSVNYYHYCNESDLTFPEKVPNTETDNLIHSYVDTVGTDHHQSVVFENTYTVKATSYAPQVTKQLLHWTSEGWKNDLTGYDKAFSFELVETDANGNIIYTDPSGAESTTQGDGWYAKVLATANNDSDGIVSFAQIPYTAAGEHYYVIREAQGTNPNITYNEGGKVVYLKVVVSDNESNLTASVEYGSYDDQKNFVKNESEAFKTFTNYYGPYSLNLELNIKKQVSIPAGSTYQLKDSEFDFNVYKYDEEATDKKGAYVTSGSNVASGNIIFGTIQITQTDVDAVKDAEGVAVFKFLVEEQGSSVPGITVDVPMIVTVTVEDKGHGNFVQTSVTYAQSKPIAGESTDNVFTNKYEANPTVLNLVANKTLIGKKLKDGEFRFILSSVDAEGKETPLNSEITVADGVVTLPEIKFEAPGSYIYTFKEKTEEDASQPNYHKYTFDKTVYTIIVHVTDDGKGQLHAVHTITTPIVDSTTGQAVDTVVGGMSFTNYYTPEGIPADLSAQIGATKTIVDVDGNELTNKPLAGYQFTVTDANGKPVLGEDGTTPITGTSGTDGKITFLPNFYFPAEGEYHYYISEDDSNKLPGYEYDTNTWALHVLVRYNPGPDDVNYTLQGKAAVAKSGELYIDDADVTCALKSTAAQQDGAGIAAQTDAEPVFVNVYKPTDTSIHLAVKKELKDRDLKAGEFTFRLLRKDAEGNYSIIVSEATNDADGNVNFHITYKLSHLSGNDERKFSYKVVEVIPENAVNGKLNGVTYDSSERSIEVTVKDVNGQIKAYWGDNEITSPIVSSTTFKNTYHAADVEVPVSATKVLTGGDLSMLSFNFELVDAEGKVVQTVSNNADGLINFKPLTFTQDDLNGEITKEFVYKLREKAGNLAAVTYDDTEYTVTITITDNLIGNLQYAVNYSNEDGLTNPVFNNTYDSTTNDTLATIQAKKTLTGKNLVADAFTFELEDEEGNILEAKNDSNGVVSFTVPYTAADTYTYTLCEKTGTDAAMQYDTKVYEVVVEVTAGEDGRLGAVVTYKTEDGEMPTFQNVYTPAAVKITLTGTKELTGRDMTAGEFKFQVLDNKGKEVATGTNTADGKIAFEDIVLTEVGSYLYSVTEIDSKDDNITYDGTKFAVGVVVTNEDGVLKADVTYEKDIKFSNTYTPDPTESPTEAPTEEPTEPSKPSTNVPDTGDHMRMDIPIILLVISLVGIMVVLALLKSSNKGKYRR